jgi:hypothetical protein
MLASNPSVLRRFCGRVFLTSPLHLKLKLDRMSENKTRMLHDADGQLHICRKDGKSQGLLHTHEPEPGCDSIQFLCLIDACD